MATELRVAYIGAGAVNFGENTPWDHATRVEQLAANLSSEAPIRVVGIADPMVAKAEEALATRKGQANETAAALYAETAVYADYKQMLAEARPNVVFVGVPPAAHGGLEGGRDIELNCLRAGAHVLSEKPLSNLPPEQVEAYSAALEQAAKSQGLVLSVGYMLRYSKLVEKARELIKEHAGGRVHMFNARYCASYTSIPHRFWWMTSRSGGPIVEQATHFVDLARFLCGEIDHSTLSGVCLPADDISGMGKLAAVPSAVGEETIPAADRVPRVTSASWRFAEGGVGSLTHAALLQGHAYDATISIWCDGLALELKNPYSACPVLLAKIGANDDEQEFRFKGDDMYLSEDAAFFEAILHKNDAVVRSPYADALKTYSFSYAIKEAATRQGAAAASATASSQQAAAASLSVSPSAPAAAHHRALSAVKASMHAEAAQSPLPQTPLPQTPSSSGNQTPLSC